MSLELKAFHSHIETLRSLLPESTVYVEILIDSLAGFEGQQTYTDDPEFIRNYDLVSDIDEIVDEIIETYEVEARHLSEENRIVANDAFTLLKDSLTNLPVTAHFLRPFFDKLGIVTIDHEEEKITSTNIYTFIRVPNLNLSRSEMESFYTALGLEADSTQGKGGHIKWFDSLGEMSDYTLSSDSSRSWVKNAIKDLLNKGMSIERIEEACKKCNIRFEKKKKSVQ